MALIIALTLLVHGPLNAEELEDSAEVGNSQFIVQTVTPPNQALVSIPMTSQGAVFTSQANRPDKAYWLDYYHQLLADSQKQDQTTAE